MWESQIVFLWSCDCTLVVQDETSSEIEIKTQSGLLQNLLICESSEA